jgi:predicted amidophosphoribosyltransferase
MFSSPRIEREAETIAVMIAIYCRDHHQTGKKLCPECSDLLKYASNRLKHCPFQEGKTTCGKCPVHCYKPAMREKIRRVMRYVGPRMLLSHPLMALRHTLDGLRKTPIKKKKHP